MQPPSGTVTFLFTDIEGSTRLWEERPDEMRAALADHDAIVRGAVEAHDGYVFATGGDGFAAAFSRAADAVDAAAKAQAGLADHPLIRVRMGIHTGEVHERDGDYFGPPVNRAARLMAVAHGAQTVCSRATMELLPFGVARSLGSHRLRDLAAPQEIFQLGEGSFPRLRSVDVVPTNLPTLLTELIGRSEDVAKLAALVTRERLVTLTGTGGVGKTRLALAVAAAVAPGFPDGVWFVEFAPSSPGGEVVQAVATAIGAPTTDLDGLAKYLSDRRVLIVLDNCEHVLSDAAEIAEDLLARAPEVVIVATSREPLGLDGESVRGVRSLDVPGADAPIDEIALASAVRLFTDRATAASGEFTLTEANVAAVVEICRHLDGIPLAIELAAARVRAIPPAEIAARLGERFRLLAGGSRRGQERHRTLLAAVSWSHDLLGDDERVVFRRLAVFPGSFDLAAAEAVAEGGEGIDVLDTLVHLVDRSLVQYESVDGRYRLLETLRQFARDRLAEASETALTRERHAVYFLDLIARIAPLLEDARYLQGHAALLTEIDNVRAAADWCIECDRWVEFARMVRRVWAFGVQSVPVDFARWYERIVEDGIDLDPQTIIDARGEMAFVAVNSLGEFQRGVAFAEESLRAAEEHALLPSPWAPLAKFLVVQYTTREPDALRACDLALTVAEARHDEFATITALGCRAVWLAELGHTEQGAACGLETVRRAERSGSPLLILEAAILAGSVYAWRTTDVDFAAALDVYERHGVWLGHDDTLSMWLDIGWGTSLVGLHRSGAVPRLARAVKLADRFGAPHAQWLALRLLAVAIAEAGHPEDAAKLAGYCDAHLSAHRIDSAAHTWISAYLDAALAGLGDRDVLEIAGASATRRQMLALVARFDATIAQPATEPAD